MSKEVIPEKDQKPKEDLPEVAQELSKVASNPKKNMLIMAGIGVVFIYLVFSLFFSSDDTKKTSETVDVPTNVTKPVADTEESSAPPIPTLPTPPKIDEPAEPPVPPAVQSVPEKKSDSAPPMPPMNKPDGMPSLPLDSSQTDGSTKSPAEPLLPVVDDKSDEEKKRLESKRRSSMILIAGTPPKKTPEQLQEEADFKNRGDMNLVLGRGKVLDAIVESAINTDFGGEIRAVISRDVYSEWGKNILIPKGSRIYGNYVTGISGNYGRIQVEWVRVDLANGYILNLSGTGVDNLGRKGAQGRVDNKFKERFTNAVLNSAFNVALAKTLDSIVEPQTSTQSAATQSGDATAIQTLANGIFADTAKTPFEKFASICAAVQTSIQDKTSTAYTSVVAACNSIQTQTGTPDQKLTALMTAVNASTNSLLQNANNSSTPSKAQQASEQAFQDIGDTVKKLIEEHDFKPTITIDQGTLIKVYVNRDYKFPKSAVSNVRVST